MPTVHAHCDGCGQDIKENEEDIVQVVDGKTEIANDQMNVQWDNEIWFGHRDCHTRPLQSSQDFLHGVVFQKLYNKFKGNYDHSVLIDLFKEHNWPLGEVE